MNDIMQYQIDKIIDSIYNDKELKYKFILLDLNCNIKSNVEELKNYIDVYIKKILIHLNYNNFIQSHAIIRNFTDVSFYITSLNADKKSINDTNIVFIESFRHFETQIKYMIIYNNYNFITNFVKNIHDIADHIQNSLVRSINLYISYINNRKQIISSSAEYCAGDLVNCTDYENFDTYNMYRDNIKKDLDCLQFIMDNILTLQ